MDKKRLKKAVLFLLAGAFLALLILYFVCTSSAFLSSVVLPQVSKAAGMDIKAKNVSLSLFQSRLSLKDFSVAEEKKEPFLKGDRLDVSFALFSIISGTIKLNKVAAGRLDVNFVKDLQGIWNFTDEEQQGSASSSAGNSAESAESSSFPVLLDISDVKIDDLNFHLKVEKKSERAFEFDCKNLQVSLPKLANEKEAHLKIEKGVLSVNGSEVELQSNALLLEIKTLLNANLEPDKLDAVFALDDVCGKIAGTDLKKRKMKLTLSVKRENKNLLIEKLNFIETRAGLTVSSLVLKGSLAPSPLKFDLDINLARLSRELAILIQEAVGEYKFGEPKLAFSAHASFEKNILKTKGELSCSNISMEHPERKLKSSLPLRLDLKHDIELNLASESAMLKSLEIGITSPKNRKLLSVNLLDSPSCVSWKNALFSCPANQKPPRISIVLSRLNLEQANLFIPSDSKQKIKSGNLNANFIVAAIPGGNIIEATGDINLDSLKINGLDLNTDTLNVHKRVRLKLKDFSKLSFSPIALSLKDNKNILASLETSGEFDFKTSRGSAELTVSEINGGVINILPDKIKNNESLEKLTKALTPFKLALKTKFMLALKQSSAKVNFFDFSFLSKNSKKLVLDSSDVVNISWAKGADIAGTPVTARLILSGIDATLANAFISPKSAFRIDSGLISGQADLRNSATGFLVKGKINANKASFSSGADKYKDISIAQGLNVKLSRQGVLTVDSSSTDLISAGKKAGSLLSFASVKLKEGNGNAKFFLEDLNENIFASMPIKTKKALDIKTAHLKGKCFVDYNTPKEKFYISNDLIMSDVKTGASLSNDIQTPLGGRLIGQLQKNKNFLKLEKFDLTLKDGKNVGLADLNAVADIKFSSGTKSNATINSKQIKLKRLEDYLVRRKKQEPKNVKAQKKNGILKKTTQGAGALLNGFLSLADQSDSTNQTAPPDLSDMKAAEPAPLDISWLDLSLKLNLKKIEYSEFLKLSCDSQVIVRNNIISLAPLKLGINGTPLKGRGFINVGASGGYPYACKAELEGLQLAPFFKMATGPDYQASKGKITRFDLDAKGKGFSPSNLQKHLRGGLKIDMKDLSLSNNLKSLYFLEIIFLPIEILSDIQKFIPNLSLSKDLTNSVNFSRKVLNSANNLKFNTGRVALKADKYIRIEKFLLKGDFVRSFAVSGYVGYNGDLSLDSELNVNRVLLPLSIGGNIHSLQPNIKKLIPFFLKENAANILNPENFKGSLKAIGEKFEKTIEKSGDEVESGDSRKTIDKDEKKLDDAIKKTRKIFDLFMENDDEKSKDKR